MEDPQTLLDFDRLKDDIPQTGQVTGGRKVDARAKLVDIQRVVHVHKLNAVFQILVKHFHDGPGEPYVFQLLLEQLLVLGV